MSMPAGTEIPLEDLNVEYQALPENGVVDENEAEAAEAGDQEPILAETSAHSNGEYHTVPGDANDEATAEAGSTEPPKAKPSSWKRLKSWWKRRFTGWRGGIVLCISATSFVLVLNIIFAIIAGAVPHPEPGFTPIYRGSCEVYERIFEGLQLLINAFSTTLLGASNYCMQRLVAPTRGEIDAAHAKKRWLDIGKPSVRNLLSINWMRIVLWALLALSSLPLHLFYNSVLIKDQATYDNIDYIVADPSIFTGNNTAWAQRISHGSELRSLISDEKYQDQRLWKNLTADECRDAYEAPYMTRGYAFGIPAQSWRKENHINTAAPMYSHSLPKEGGSIPVDSDMLAPSPTAFPLDYCISQEVPGRCAIQFSLTIIGIVIGCGVVKLATMCVMLWKFIREDSIVTVGDSVQSFIETPDVNTKNLCLESRHSITKAWKTPPMGRRGQTFHKPSKEFWFRAASIKRWSVPIILFVIGTAIAISIAKGNQVYCENYIVLKQRCYMNKFGKLNPHYLLNPPTLRGTNSIVLYALLANTPQLIASIFYFTYNGLFTSTLTNREWAQYSIKRAPLRVSVPKQGQRSTYFLQLPYIFSVPLILLSVLFHWFISQTVFVSRVVSWDALNPDKPTGKPSSELGYSLYALVGTLVCGLVLMVACLLVGIIGRYPAEGMPMGGTNSAIISAACHVIRTSGEQVANKDEGDSVVNRPLKWGVTKEGSRNLAGHCSFSDEEVSEPTIGFLYAGNQ